MKLTINNDKGGTACTLTDILNTREHGHDYKIGTVCFYEGVAIMDTLHILNIKELDGFQSR